MSLRSAILKATIPLIPEAGFSRAALSAGLASLPASSSKVQDDAGREAVIDTLFSGNAASDAPRALVQAWEDEGRAIMHNGVKGDALERLVTVLGRRLEWSASVGEHLLDAHALLVAPTSSTPLPAPLLALLDRVPCPPFPISRVVDPLPHSPTLGSTGGRLPLPGLHAAAPLMYAWRVADEAVYAAQPDKGRQGVMREPAGAGVEWYSHRAGLALAYLQAEAYLLQPIDTATKAPAPGYNPHLPTALASLRDSLGQYATARRSLGQAESATESAISFIELMTRSIAGIVRSRGF
ncbi:hypothetical protein CcaverHIS002_0403370 [Cutaneotrichosporon cavernicola]|uniref:COQ9 domain-containing protein n=1 Tax=Cutaneotrichosporon cavernicola TaxID=279322 RepID=A0AA48L3Z6_9TREE|nr:uncharacterized protein CcaverHIS019_0403330 [Cutaneotrichosporon cavernicola]BEI83733.1 hypothetical protein CcaverHIS002_0403370 [Cutaneotrichosporon cavernicola]BEI91513.1 hypothetical protein CcaverHIS019_0403330 [Cutaneotrichosporon cavernicola]BEI99288.1 hypothetical protein CcaverHIS631_0403310 [Cutaneotrichosporon cavernicola]BEJ07065.1 hypothetical protein CcaverHIS641_0403340 [Cutaneotrichosporon cavernicola]